eukprot:scaffold109524_cov28-Prasinocladus_malaysianus.AAC.2
MESKQEDGKTGALSCTSFVYKGTGRKVGLQIGFDSLIGKTFWQNSATGFLFDNTEITVMHRQMKETQTQQHEALLELQAHWPSASGTLAASGIRSQTPALTAASAPSGGDGVEPYDTELAMRILEEEIEASVTDIFSDLSSEPIASASFGQ